MGARMTRGERARGGLELAERATEQLEFKGAALAEAALALGVGAPQLLRRVLRSSGAESERQVNGRRVEIPFLEGRRTVAKRDDARLRSGLLLGEPRVAENTTRAQRPRWNLQTAALGD